MEFGEKLKLLREEKNMTQSELAEKLMVSRDAVSKWENSKRYPDIFMVKMISKEFNVSVDYLLDEESFKDYTEKSSLMSDIRDNRIMSCFYLLAAVFTFIKLSQIILYIISAIKNPEYIVNIFQFIWLGYHIAFIVVSLYGFIKSMKNQLNAKVAGILALLFFIFGVNEAAIPIITLVDGISAQFIAEVMKAVLCSVVAVLYFCYRKESLYKWVILIVGFSFFLTTINFIWILSSYLSYGDLPIVTSIVLELCFYFQSVTYYGVILMQTYLLHNKRKQFKKLNDTK